MRALLASAALAGSGLLAACGPTVIKATCGAPMAQEFNEPQLCLGPPVLLDGVQVCSSVGGGSLVPLCLVGPDGRAFLAFLSPLATIEGTGWTYAGGGHASTVSAADAARCAKLMPADGGAVPACP